MRSGLGSASARNALIAGIYYLAFLALTNGKTVGKMVCGLRVVRQDGDEISLLTAFLRNVVGYMLSGIFALGFIWAIFDKEKQTWHDKLARTYVVRE